MAGAIVDTLALSAGEVGDALQQLDLGLTALEQVEGLARFGNQDLCTLLSKVIHPQEDERFRWS